MPFTGLKWLEWLGLNVIIEDRCDLESVVLVGALRFHKGRELAASLFIKFTLPPLILEWVRVAVRVPSGANE